jgi:hypothetical protein
MSLFMFIFEYFLQCIKVLPFYHVQYIHPSPFSEVPLHFLIAGQLSGKLGGPALLQANALPTELRRTHF